jgi:hypothetical protein
LPMKKNTHDETIILFVQNMCSFSFYYVYALYFYFNDLQKFRVMFEFARRIFPTLFLRAKSEIL